MAPAAALVTIAMGFDAGYAPHAAAVVVSIVRHAPKGCFRFLMLHDGVGESVRRQVEAVAPKAEFLWREVGDDDVPAFATREHLTRATLFRLALEQLAPDDVARVIYLDVDIAVAHDLRELWAVDLGDNLVGAVTDDSVAPEALASRWGLAAGGGYFNAGVLLIDLARVRAEGVFSAALEFVATHGHDLPYNDQDALNWACWGRWRRLDRVWNVQRPAAMACDRGPVDGLQDAAPRIIHFTEAFKPWIRGAFHPWAWLYWRNLQQTPFLAEVARKSGIGRLERFRLWLRWLRRWRPAGRSRLRNLVLQP